MAERGAPHLVYLTRSGASSLEARDMIRDLNHRGVHTEVVRGDISIKEDVTALVDQASRARPVKGIVHAAMIVEVRLCPLESNRPY